MRLYVGNLAYSTTENGLREAFEKFGTVTSSVVVIDRMSGRSRGFGFVEFATQPEAEAAIDALNGQEVDGRAIVVNQAREREAGGGRGGGGRPPRQFDGGGASAGRGGGGGRGWDDRAGDRRDRGRGRGPR
jgi:RNA recognition motif-containing protein